MMGSHKQGSNLILSRLLQRVSDALAVIPKDGGVTFDLTRAYYGLNRQEITPLWLLDSG